MGEKFIGIIPARRGSKGLVNKNILKINGKTLLEISVECALECASLDQIIVSTDYEISETGLERFQGNKKFLFLSRSSSNGRDNTSTEDVIKEIVKHLYLSVDHADYHIVLLQPTSPLRKSFHISESINLYKKSNLHKLASFVKVGEHHPDRMYRLNGSSATSYRTGESVSGRRQLLEDLYLRNGAIYICNLNLIVHGERFASATLIPFIMEEIYSVNIDCEFDFNLAKCLMTNESITSRAS
jgi:CMP-N,N'-diacetyllegionaminic acid synthase